MGRLGINHTALLLPLGFSLGVDPFFVSGLKVIEMSCVEENLRNTRLLREDSFSLLFPSLLDSVLQVLLVRLSLKSNKENCSSFGSWFEFVAMFLFMQFQNNGHQHLKSDNNGIASFCGK